MKRLAISIVGLVILLVTAVAQADLRGYAATLYKGVHFESLGIKDGLSHQSVTAMVKDQQGFMWIGTQTGLNRFDGHEVRVYREERNQPWSLPNEHITALKRAPHDHLWIGTLGGGLVSLDLPTGRFETVPTVEERAGSAIVLDLAQDDLGNVWIATEGGLGVLAQGSDHIRFVTPPSVRVRQLTTVAGGGVLALTTDSLLRFDLPESKPVKIATQANNAADLQFIAPVRARQQAPGVYWAVAGSQLYRATLDKNNILQLEPLAQSAVKSPRAISEDAWGNLWVGGIDGLNVYVASKRAFVEPSQYIRGSDRGMRSLYMSGNEVWLGSNLEGALYANLVAQVGINVVAPHGAPIVSEYAMDNGLVVVGAHPGLYAFNPDSLHFAAMLPNGDSQPSVVSFLKVGDRIWFSATNGIGWFNKSNFEPHFTMHQAFEYPLLMASMSNGNLVMSTGAEIVEFSSDGRKIVQRDPMARTLVRVAIDDHRTLIGGFYGAKLFDSRCRCTEDLLANYPRATPIVTAIHKGAEHQGTDNTWWLGTHSQGLVEMTWNGHDIPTSEDFRIRDRSNGLAANAIGGIQQDKHGDMWMSTTVGFSRLHVSSGTIDNYSASEGAAEKGYIIGASAQTPNGQIVFGGPHSISVIPGPPEGSIVAPAPRVTDIKLANQHVSSRAVDEHSPIEKLPPYNTHVVLPYGSPALTFDFSTLAYPTPRNLGYAYRLVPLEDTWTNTADGRLLATYTSLAPGSYQFEVSNDPGHQQVSRTTIEVTPPWFLRSWVILFFGLGMVGIIWLGVRFRVSTLAKRAERLAHEVHARTAELTQANLDLKEALEQVKTLRGIVPICANCKKIRDDDGYWQQLEVYMREHTEAEFSHGICADCMELLYADEHHIDGAHKH